MSGANCFFHARVAAAPLEKSGKVGCFSAIFTQCNLGEVAENAGKSGLLWGYGITKHAAFAFARPYTAENDQSEEVRSEAIKSGSS